LNLEAGSKHVERGEWEEGAQKKGEKRPDIGFWERNKETIVTAISSINE